MNLRVSKSDNPFLLCLGTTKRFDFGSSPMYPLKSNIKPGKKHKFLAFISLFEGVTVPKRLTTWAASKTWSCFCHLEGIEHDWTLEMIHILFKFFISAPPSALRVQLEHHSGLRFLHPSPRASRWNWKGNTFWKKRDHIYPYLVLTPPKLTCHLNGDHFKRKLVLQPAFSGGIR